jgi:hypothetical protein
MGITKPHNQEGRASNVSGEVANASRLFKSTLRIDQPYQISAAGSASIVPGCKAEETGEVNEADFDEILHITRTSGLNLVEELQD